jgi:hypothetical protein
LQMWIKLVRFYLLNQISCVLLTPFGEKPHWLLNP